MPAQPRVSLSALQEAHTGFVDDLLMHQVRLERLTAGEIANARKVLLAAERKLAEQIRARMAWIGQRGYDSSDFTLRRLEANLRELQATIRETGGVLRSQIRSSALATGRYEGDWLAARIAGAGSEVGLALNVNRMTPDFLRTVIRDTPFGGGKLSEWVARFEANTFNRVRSTIRSGFVRGEGVEQIVRTLRGTQAAKYTDGLLNASRRELSTLVYSAHAHVYNEAREWTYLNNPEVVEGIEWIATLDADTCPICAPLDGLTWDLPNYRPRNHSIEYGEGPGRIHPNCRCVPAPVMNFTPKLANTKRASMQGLVSGKTKYKDWLGRQSYKRQAEVLGVRRAQMIRAGDVSVPRLWAPDGTFLKLDALIAREGLR